MKAKIEGGGGGGNEAPSADALENGVSDDLLVEYAKSNRSKCKNCKEQIDKVRFPSQKDDLFLFEVTPKEFDLTCSLFISRNAC